MRTLFHSLVYLALGVWLGALIFFGAILAPLAFSQLPPLFGAQGVHAAGLIVGGSLVRLHWMALFCGVIFLLVMLLVRRWKARMPIPVAAAAATPADDAMRDRIRRETEY